MAKIDLTQIEGYSDMTPEEKLKALEGLELPDPDYTGWIKKDLYDRTASDLAKLKKELRDKMTDDERKKQMEKEEREELENRYNALLRESQIAKNKAEYLSMGYEESLAEDTATALIDGDMEKVFANQKVHLENVRKEAVKEAMRDVPKPKGGNSGKSMTIENFRKLSPQERYDFSINHPEEYKQMYTTGG